VVSIYGYQGSREVVRGMGVCIDSERVLTSAHVVRDDRVNYQLSIINYNLLTPDVTVLERDPIADMAYMKMNHEP
jgi:S1-C subfamily serine protease